MKLKRTKLTSASSLNFPGTDADDFEWSLLDPIVLKLNRTIPLNVETLEIAAKLQKYSQEKEEN